MKEHMPKRIFFVLELLALLTAALVFNIVLYILNPYTIVWYIILWLLGAFVIFVVFFYIPYYYVNFLLYICDDYVMVKTGVIFEKKQYLYRDSVCYVSVYKNPFTRILSISTLVVGAAGGNIVIPLLDSKNAKKMQQALCNTNIEEELT